MPFKRMLAFTMSVVCQVGLFTSPILALDARGRWIGNVEEGVKLLAACYFQLHRNVFITAVSSAADMFARSSRDVKSFVANVRETIWRVHGAQGKKNCPALDALELHVKRGLSVIEYWQGAFDEDMEIPYFRGRGWRAISGDSQQELTSENVVLQLSEYALLGTGGKVKLLTCGCRSDTNPKCSRCTCGKAGRSCVPGYCKCKLKCIGLEDNVDAAVTNGGGKFGDAQDMWMQNLLNVGASGRGEVDASTTSDMGDSLEDLENDVT